MEDDRANATLKKQEKGPLDRFKNQNLLLKKFGQDGLRVYSAIGTGKTAGEVLAETGISEERFVAVLAFMEQNAIISIIAEREAPAPKTAPEQIEPSISPRGRTVRREEEQQITPEIQPEEPATQDSSSSDEITPIQPITPKGKTSSRAKIEPEEGGIEPISPIRSEYSPEVKKPSRGRVPPLSEPEPEPEPEAAPEEAPAPTPEPEPEAPIKPSERTKEAPRSGPEPPPNLSPLEKIIFGKYGETGVRVYNLIDGEKTAEEILNETGISEVQLVEMLEFMDTQGIIKLEKPETAKPEPSPAPASDEFKPIVEEVPEAIVSESEAPGAGESLGIIPIDLVAKANMSMFQSIETQGRMLAKFGNTGKALFAMIDGQKDIIDLCLFTRLSFVELDSMFAFLGKRGAILFRPLTREEVKAKYGEDGFTVYKRYGRDGILLYELIGKEASLKDIILGSRIDPARGVEIFMFIHEVLGLEIPFDRDIIYKQLGLA